MTDKNKSTAINAVLKLDEVAADLRSLGYMEGDAVYDELLNLRNHAAVEFSIPGLPEAYK